MKVRYLLAALVAISSFLAVPVLAHADTLTTFYLNGVTLQVGYARGTVTIDTTTGVVTAGNINLSNGTSSFVFNITDGTGNTAVDTYFDFLDSGGDIYQLSVAPTTLVGYSGSPICTYGVRCSGFTGGYFPSGNINGPSSDYNTAGSLSLTPEPSTLVLLVTGVGLAGVARFRSLPPEGNRTV